MVDGLMICSRIQFVSILLCVFASIFMREIDLSLTFFVESLFDFSIRVTVASQNEFADLPSVPHVTLL